jgi:hypothetical protein
MRLPSPTYAFFAIVGSVIGQNGPDVAETEQRLSSHQALFSAYDHGKPLTALQPDSRGSVEFTFDAINHYAANGWICFADEEDCNKRALRELALDDLARRINYGDAIVTATAEAQRSAFTPRQSFIYSDWDFRVVNVFKNNSSVPTPLGQLITVVRSGGTITRNGIAYTVYDKTFPDFNPGSTYILFLRQLPESHSFAAGAGALLISASAISALNDYQDPSPIPELLKSLTTRQFGELIDYDVSTANKKP